MKRRPAAAVLDELAAAVILAEPGDREGLRTLEELCMELSGCLVHRCDQAWQHQVEGWSKQLTKLKRARAKTVQRGLDELSSQIAAFQKALQELVPEQEKGEQGPSLEQTTHDTQKTGLQRPPWVTAQALAEFLSNQEHALEEIEADIITIDEDAGDPDTLRGKIHTLKGEAGLLGLQDLAKVCHGLEDFLAAADTLARYTDLLLHVKDWASGALRAYAAGRLPEPRAKVVLAALKSAIGENRQPTVAGQPATRDQSSVPYEDEENLEVLADFLDESSDGIDRVDHLLLTIETDGATAESVNSLFRVFHSMKGMASFLGLQDLAMLAHATETLLNAVREGQLQLAGDVIDLAFDATATVRSRLRRLRRTLEHKEESSPDSSIEPLLGRIGSIIGQQHLEFGAQDERERSREHISSEDEASSQSEDSADPSHQERGSSEAEVLAGTTDQGEPGDASKQRASASGTSHDRAGTVAIRETIKVDLERVDRLVEMIGELVVSESMVVHAPEITSLDSPRVSSYLTQLGRITRELQDVGMRMRMVPVRGLFQKMARMVRDLARKSGKQVRLHTEGEGTEIDRNMVEQVADPLMHMIRNAVGHGIETEDERRETGKDPQGTITLSAHAEGGSIIITVADDGRGLDWGTILQRARNQGVVEETATPSEAELQSLIFVPGFSTTERVNEISGRGVGLDVVKKKVNALRGRISISSTPGEGTSFQLILPLTLAIIDGMLVACGGERYIIPTLSIVESIQASASMLSRFAGRNELVNVRGESLPLLRLEHCLEVPEAVKDPTQGLIVVVEGVGRKVALLVDEVLTQHQVVIKSLGTGVGPTPLVSGAAIMSDGRVGLILNIEELAAAAQGGESLPAAASVSQTPTDREAHHHAVTAGLQG